MGIPLDTRKLAQAVCLQQVAEARFELVRDDEIAQRVHADAVSSTDKLSQTAPIDTAEASKVLAKYVAEVVERGLDNLRDNGGALNAQVALANQIITTIQAETKEDIFEKIGQIPSFN